MGLLDNLASVYEGITPDRQDLAKVKFAQENQQRQSRDIYARGTAARVKAFKVLTHPDTAIPAFFNKDQTAWDKYKKDLEYRLNTGAGVDSITPSDIFKIQGKNAFVDYLNDTNLAPTYLGSNKFLGMDSEVDFVADQKEGTERLSLLPSVRTVEQDEEGRVRIYSADADYKGRKLRDIYAEGGEEAVDSARIGGLPMDFIDQIDSDHRMNVGERGRAEMNFGLLSGNVFETLNNSGTPTDVRSGLFADAYEKYERLRKSSGEDQTVVDPEVVAETDAIGEATRKFATPGAGAFPDYFPDDPVMAGARDSGTGEIRSFVPYTPKTGDAINKIVTSLNTSLFGFGTPYSPSHLTTDVARDRWMDSPWSKYLKQGPYPFNASEEEWSQMGKKGRADATALEARILRENALRYMALTHNKLENRYTQHKTATGSSTNVQDLENDEKVRKFYAEHLKGAENIGSIPKDRAMGKLQDVLEAKPDLYKQYQEDPYQFALDYMNDTNKLYGPPSNPKDNTKIKNLTAGANLTAAEEALRKRDIPAFIEEVTKITKKPSAEDQQRFADVLRARGGDHYRYSPPVKTAVAVALAASVDKAPPSYQALTNSNVLPVYLETGNFTLAQETLRQNAEATQVQRDRLTQNSREFNYKTRTELASGQYSSNGSEFNKKALDLMDDISEAENSWFDSSSPLMQSLGRRIQQEAGRLAIVVEGDPTLSLRENKQDYYGLMRVQAQLIKQAIIAKTKPGFIMDWFYRDPAAEILELNADVEVRDKAGEPITDPRRASEAYTIVNNTNEIDLSAEGIRDDFGMTVITHLITLAQARELGL